MTGLSQAYCAVLRLANPIGFSDESEQSVQLIFALLVPENYDEKHLCILAYLSERLRDANFRSRLQQAQNRDMLYQILVDSE